MKKLLFLLLPTVILFSCTDKKAKTETATGDNVVTTETKDGDDHMTTDYSNVTMPYTVAKTPDWVPGDANNVGVAMNALHAFEMNDMSALSATLADSVEFYIDNVNFKGTRDSLVRFLTKMRNGADTMSIRMHDFESVKSKSRGDEWVGLWYTESVKMKGGKMDSSMVMDDIKFVNGKITIIDSKGRKLAKSK